MDDIIYLEPDEEITSVIDKLKVLNPEVKNVSLVIPKGAALLQSVVNLKLLKKEGVSLNQDLSIVTQDRIGRNLASQAGFTVYDNVNSHKPTIEPPRPEPNTDDIIEMDMTGEKLDEEKAPEGIAVNRYDASGKPVEAPPVETPPMEDPIKEAPIEPKMETPQPVITSEPKESPKVETTVHKPEKNYAGLKASRPADPKSKKKKILAIAISLLVIGGAILFYVFYPKAIVTLAMKSEPLEEEVEINIDNNINTPNIEQKSIPGELLELEKDAEKSFPATGKKEVGDKARGTVSISNNSGDAQKVNSGTDLKSDSGLHFKTSADVTVPGATVGGGGNIVPGKADVAVEASESGDKYNIGPASFSISGKDLLGGKSTSPMSGGSSKEITIVSQNDINDAKNSLAQDSYITLHEELKTKAEGATVLDAAIKDEILSDEASKNAGDETSEFTMKVHVKSSTITFQENDLREIVVKVLEKTIPEDKMLNLSTTDEITTKNADIDLKNGITKLTCLVKTNIITRIDADNIKKSIKGLNRSDAEITLKNIQGIESVDIVLKPSWLIKKIPTRDKNVEIKIESKMPES